MSRFPPDGDVRAPSIGHASSTAPLALGEPGNRCGDFRIAREVPALGVSQACFDVGELPRFSSDKVTDRLRGYI
jgi:hypothetical protein